MDPVVRCDSCGKIVLRANLEKIGMADCCGNRRVKKMSTFNDAEEAQMVEWGVDKDFLVLFGPVGLKERDDDGE